MKHKLLVFAVSALILFGFSSLSVAQCPDTVDHGQCDTIYVEPLCGDEVLGGIGPYNVRAGIFITHDVPDPIIDSLSAIVTPFCYTHTNVATYCSLGSFWNDTYLPYFPGWDNHSIFRWYDCGGGADSSFMSNLALIGQTWSNIIFDLGDFVSHFWLSCIPTTQPLFGANTHRFWAMMTFRMGDSTTITVDSCFWPPNSKLSFTRADAKSYQPQYTSPTIIECYIPPNIPPTVTCPSNQSHSTNGAVQIAGPFSADDTDGTVSTVTIAFSGAGVTGEALYDVTGLGTAHAEFSVQYIVDDHCAAGGTMTITATDDGAGVGQCTFDVDLTNADPVITCPTPPAFIVNDKEYSATATATDANGDALEFTKTAGPAGLVVDTDGGITWTPSCDDTLSNPHTVTVQVEDVCGATDECSFQLTVMCVTNPAVMLGSCDDPCVNPGDLVYFPIEITNSFVEHDIGGFELHIDFDYTAMTFVGVDKGPLIEGFEEFTYRLLPCPLCGCCKYKILLFGMYDLPDGPVGTPIPAGTTGTLAYLKFVVNSNESLRGFCIPVCWQWTPCEYQPPEGLDPFDPDCGENTFSDVTGNVLLTSYYTCQFDEDCCDDPGTEIEDIVLFQHDEPMAKDTDCDVIPNCGGIMVCEAGVANCKRGDINLNNVTYEVADAVLFASYFVEGITVFGPPGDDRDAKICGTDVNADGRALTISDLVYLIRVILKDAVEIPKLAPSSEIAHVVVSNGVITTECSSPIAAILFEFDSAVSPTLLAGNMEMMNYGSKVLVWSREGNTLEAATQVLSFAGDAGLTSVSAVGYDTYELTTTISAKVAPSAFALNPAYPNPFNPFVNLSFTLPGAVNYSLNIYNVAGQLVRSYDGIGMTGLNVITWNGRDNAGVEVASGIYFYKLSAAGFSATQKMVMMK